MTTTSMPTAAKLLALLALLGLGACALDDPSEGDDAPDIVVTTDALSAHALGVDYSFSRPSKRALFDEGYRFVARYFSYDQQDTHGKILFPAEAHRLEAAGLAIVSNWEYGATDALGGFSAGVADAKEANRQAAAAGAPPDRPIYFSVDFDATPGQQAAINAYLDGAASVIGRHRVGIYGGYYPVKRALDAGKARWAWQTTAWSGGQWVTRAKVRQVENGISAGNDNGCCDRDVAQAVDIGQWSDVSELVDAHSGKCLDIAGGNTDNGTNIRLWECNGHGAQAFRVEQHGSTVVLVNPRSGKCVDVARSGTANGTNVRLWHCNGTSAQTFRMEADDGHVTFVNTNSHKCLDVDRRGTTDGTNIQLWECNGGSNQHWHLVASPWAASHPVAMAEAAGDSGAP